MKKVANVKKKSYLCTSKEHLDGGQRELNKTAYDKRREIKNDCNFS